MKDDREAKVYLSNNEKVKHNFITFTIIEVPQSDINKWCKRLFILKNKDIVILSISSF